MHLPDALAPLARYNQFILWRKTDKKPIDHRTLSPFEKDSGWQSDPACWVDFQTASNLSEQNGFGVGFIFTNQDPFFFVDIDNCFDANRNNWSPFAISILNQLNGAGVEISQSGTGLHVFGTGQVPEHSNKYNDGLNKIELYTEKRYCALTGMNTKGNAFKDCTKEIFPIVQKYFPAKKTILTHWTTTPVAEYTSPGDDDKLIEKALNQKSIASKMGGKASFRELWENDIEALTRAFPPMSGKYVYDQNRADLALAQHLAFWTGNNCEHILNLMWCSKLVREKWWIHKEYLANLTIMKAVSMQEIVYTAGEKPEYPLTKEYNAKSLSGSKDQIKWAKSIREEKFQECGTDQELIKQLCVKHGPVTQAYFWIENQGATPQEIAQQVKPIDPIKPQLITEPTIVEGYQYLPADRQIEHFKGCTYVQDINKILVPTGLQMDAQRFNSSYGGYVFQMDSEASGKTTRNAFDAFTQGMVKYPQAQATTFRPDRPPGDLIDEEGLIYVNSYVPIETKKIEGDVSIFLDHLNRILPDKRDQSILLAYMAACIQHKGFKFKWCPLIQGVQGNGKTTLTECVAFAIGQRYTHMPPAKYMAEKFNEWFFDKLFIGVEDVYVAEHKFELLETLKPMITGERLAKRAMQRSQVMFTVCANLMLNMNKQDGFRKTKNDRRYAPFYCAQQAKEDLIRDGMDAKYFQNLKDWLKGNGQYKKYGSMYGFSIVNWYLSNYQIPLELNPCLEVGGLAHIAPLTSSTDAAIVNSMGSIEQEVLEAIDEGRIGFSGGWISSIHLEEFLKSIGAARKISRNKRREFLQNLGYDWHPGLNDGRVDNYISIDRGKPRLFIKNGHLALNLTNRVDIVESYVKAQSNASENYIQSKLEGFKR